MKKFMCLVVITLVLFSFSMETFAILDFENRSIKNSQHITDDQIDKLVSIIDDYASIVELLDVQKLFNFSIDISTENPEKSEEEINLILKKEILKEGFISGLLKLDNQGNIIFDDQNVIRPSSYGDLPYIREKLGTNEKKVFNESLSKGLGVLSAAQFSMNNYKSYYTSSSNYADDNADAFRHGVWMARAAFNSGADYARRFGVAHEDDFPSTSLSRSMDLYNNNRGIDVSSSIPSNTPPDLLPSIVLNLVNQRVKNGTFRRFKGSDIGTKTSLVPTNSTGSKK